MRRVSLKSLAERRRHKRAARGDSPEKRAERHVPKDDVIGTMLRIGGVERESRFKRE